MNESKYLTYDIIDRWYNKDENLYFCVCEQYRLFSSSNKIEGETVNAFLFDWTTAYGCPLEYIQSEATKYIMKKRHIFLKTERSKERRKFTKIQKNLEADKELLEAQLNHAKAFYGLS